jgi:hypothetical protein
MDISLKAEAVFGAIERSKRFPRPGYERWRYHLAEKNYLSNIRRFIENCREAGQGSGKKMQFLTVDHF